MLGLGALLGFAGPFAGNPPLSPPVRYAFWIGMVFAGYLAALAADRLLTVGPSWRPELRLAATALASAVPLTFVAAWAIPLVRPGHTYQPLQLPALFGPVVVVQLAIVLALLRKAGAPPEATRPAEPTPAARDPSGALQNPLLARLPKRLGDAFVALEAEDHYLRVHTSLGSDLVLMRLSDAIAAIEPGLGLQVHRSWWVAHDAMCELVRTERRTQLRLKNGLLVPIGRTYSAAVRSHTARLRLVS